MRWLRFYCTVTIVFVTDVASIFWGQTYLPTNLNYTVRKILHHVLLFYYVFFLLFSTHYLCAILQSQNPPLKYYKSPNMATQRWPMRKMMVFCIWISSQRSMVLISFKAYLLKIDYFEFWGSSPLPSRSLFIKLENDLSVELVWFLVESSS